MTFNYCQSITVSATTGGIEPFANQSATPTVGRHGCMIQVPSSASYNVQILPAVDNAPTYGNAIAEVAPGASFDFNSAGLFKLKGVGGTSTVYVTEYNKGAGD